jgi:hypothetical protein
MIRRRFWVLAGAAAIAIAVSSTAVHAYLTLASSVAGTSVTARWAAMPINYFVTNRGAGPVTAAQMQAATAASFASWAAVPTARVSAVFAGFTNLEPVREDGATVIGFQSHPELDRTLGVTSFTVDRVTGQLVEVDIYLNSFIDWSVAPSGETGRFDVQSVMTHEVGHLLGLGHSSLGETVFRPDGGRRVLGKRTVMFPVAYAVGTVLDRTLQDDDIAAISLTYPTDGFLNKTGTIAGNVTLDGAGVFGAHLLAFNLATQQTVGGFSLDQNGRFVIDGLTPGTYLLRVEPIDDADTTSFFESSANVNVNFKAMYHDKLIAVPAGGAGKNVDVRVIRK